MVGGSIVAGSFVSNDGNKTFSFQVVPDANASEVKLEVSSGVASYGSEPILAINRTIGVVPDVLAKNELTNWWWYNEALGQVASDSVGSNHGQLIGGTKWAADAIEGTSLQFEKAGQMLDFGKVNTSFNPGRFQLSFWFKRKEEGFSWSTEQVSNVMLSLGDINGSALQIGLSLIHI